MDTGGGDCLGKIPPPQLWKKIAGGVRGKNHRGSGKKSRGKLREEEERKERKGWRGREKRKEKEKKGENKGRLVGF